MSSDQANAPQAYQIDRELRAKSWAPALSNLADAIRAGRLVPFLGAGLSREWPTLIPLTRGQPLDDSSPVAALCAILPLVHNALVEILENCSTEDSKTIRTKYLATVGLEQLLEPLTIVVGNQALDILKVCQAVPNGLLLAPNYRHHAIAQLARDAAGTIRTPDIITLNFDTFLEVALNQLGICALVPEAESDERAAYHAGTARAYNHGRTHVNLYKLHGSINNPPSIITTMETLGTGLPHHKAQLLTSILEGRDLLIAGYSDNDVDIFTCLERIPQRHVFWHAHHGLCPGEHGDARIIDYLARREHTILSGDLTTILQALLRHLGEDSSDASITKGLGISNIDKIPQREQACVKQRNTELRQQLSTDGLPWLNPAVAALVLTNHVGAGDKASAELRERLWNAIKPDALGTVARRAFNAQLAERHTNEGRSNEAIAIRTALISEVRSGPSAKGETSQATAAFLVEQAIRRAHDHGRVFAQRRNPGQAIRLWAAYHSAKNLLREFDGALSPPERDRFRKMLEIPKADYWRFKVQQLVLWRVQARVDGKSTPSREARLRRRLARCAAKAEREYQEIITADYGAGWTGHALLQLAETIMHRSEAVPAEVDTLLTRARWRTRRSWTHEGAPEDRDPDVGPHEGLRYLYRGQVTKAVSVLKKTLDYYECTRHRSGKAKTLLYLALAYEQQGDRKLAGDALAQRSQVLNDGA